MIHLIRQECLNGWWDYRLVTNGENSAAVPSDGWETNCYLVPSLVTKSLAGVRRKGETFYQEHLNADPVPFCNGEHEFLFDNHDYPVGWMAAESGWARRCVTVGPMAPGRRRFLKLDAVAGRSEVWINGRQVSTHDDAFLPNEIDVTDLFREGDNELAVLIRDYERLSDDRKKTLTPSGNMMTAHMRGIWQDVWLIERGEVYVADTTIRTSFREKTLTVSSEIRNASNSTREVALRCDVTEWIKEDAAFSGASVLDLPVRTASIPTGASVMVEQTVDWPNPKLWQPEAPHLYWLRSRVECGGTEIDRRAERFGFREVWIEGPDFLLNGFPVHFFSDWGHKVNQLHHTEAWNRCWFAMMKAENFNHSRLHTHPHPKLILDLADEEGIMITGETAIHGSGGEQAADEDRYWEAAEAHIRAFIRRDKNHPSVLLWSIENEMRWNQDKTDQTKRRLPGFYRLFRELDPTREAYHEGDSSLWNENEQAIMSRHYGKECGGYGWWDKRRPLHAGEMSAYHYMGPATNFHTAGGDEVWADYQKVVEAAARETLWIVEAGRSQGTAAFGPWNISCLCNLRPTPELVELDYEDWTTPGVKPHFVNPHSAEFAFWKPEGPHYLPFGETNAIQARGFRPFAIIDLSHRRGYFGGKTIARTLYLVNDTPQDQSGLVRVEVVAGDTVLWENSFPCDLARGRALSHQLAITLPGVERALPVTFRTAFKNTKGEILDGWEQPWTLHPSVPECHADRSARIMLIGDGPARSWLEALGFSFEHKASFDAPLDSGIDLVILERDTITPGSHQNRWVENFLSSGGRLLLLEQKHSLFPGVPLESKPQIHGFLRGYGHPVLAGFSQNDVQFWGEDPYASMDSDSHIAHRLYQKGEACLLQPLIDAGEGGFGLKLPEWIALGELRVGSGRLLASQFRFADKASTIPEAGRLFVAMLEDLLGKAAPCAKFAEADSGDAEAVRATLDLATDGGNAFIRLRDPKGADAVGKMLGINLIPVSGDRYHAVRKSDDSALAGISHVDVSGLDGMTYCFGMESKAVASFGLETTSGLEPLLVTPTRAFLEEQHIHGQRVEALRAHGASRFLFAESPGEFVLLARVSHGAGWVYLDVFGRPEETHPRLERYESMLCRNLGKIPEASALSGAAVPAGIASSEGFPKQVCLQMVTSAELRAALISSTALPAERMAPSSMFRVGEWSVCEAEDGIWEAPGSSEAALFTCLYSPRARKIVMEDSGIPNPGSLTFLDVCAPGGTVELVLNGRPVGTRAIEGGKATFSDLELAQHFNQVLLLWKGSSPGERLHFRFRDIMRNPESDLFFLRSDPGGTHWVQQEF